MDIGKHEVDTEDLAVAANALDALEDRVTDILTESTPNNGLGNENSRRLCARHIVSTIVRRLSGIQRPTDEEPAP